MSHPEIDNLISSKTRIYRRGDSEYKINAYQYATTSRNGMSPSVIIYPEGLQEILNIVDYAKKKKIAVAVRTGGHQYSGASSTSGENVLLDLSDTFEDPKVDFSYNENDNLLKVGISFSMLEYYTILKARGMFTPGGICSHVHLGGHVQTGGYGMLTRSFGLLSDFIEGFDIVLADGNQARAVTVWKPNSEFATGDQIAGNDDLFWAVLGGSPGNFGILTHVRIRPLHDKDYPDSRMMMFITPYTPEKHRALQTIHSEMSGDPELPKNFQFMITIMGRKIPTFSGAEFFDLSIEEGKELNEDEKMMHMHGEQYGDGVPWAEEGKGSVFFMMDGEIPVNMTKSAPFSPILVYVKWDNVNGSAEKFTEDDAKWFVRIREASIEKEVVDYPRWPTPEALTNFVKRMDGEEVEYEIIDFRVPLPSSFQQRQFTYDEVREFNQSAYKRTYMSEKYDLRDNGYIDWAVERIKEIDDFGKENNYSVNFILEVQLAGGKHSMLAAGNPKHSAHSWRDDMTENVILDAFYDPHDEKAKEFAKAWIDENDRMMGPNGLYSEFDRRFLWATFGKSTDPDSGYVMDTVWDKYYDSREKYDKLIEIKRRFDPGYVFTANGLGVDATSAPYKQCLKFSEK